MHKSIQELFRVFGLCAMWFAIGATWANHHAETRFREQIHPAVERSPQVILKMEQVGPDCGVIQPPEIADHRP